MAEPSASRGVTSTGATTSSATPERAARSVRASIDGEYVAADGGFGYANLHILNGSHYSAYFSDALLLAAWTEGGLSDVASKPRWLRQNTGMAVRRIAIKSAEDGFTVHVPDDADAETPRRVSAGTRDLPDRRRRPGAREAA